MKIENGFLHIRIKKGLHDKAKKIAEAKGTTVSAMIKKSLENQVTKYKGVLEDEN